MTTEAVSMATIVESLASAPRPWSVSFVESVRRYPNQTRIYINDANGNHVAECYLELEAEAIVTLVNQIP